ncbi:MAG: hypothetical protein SGJ27_05525 [Candidatus Melainabacteria bacterium]|nr:hypothetical protein [Candidatus Melainabacteria bacterium]
MADRFTERLPDWQLLAGKRNAKRFPASHNGKNNKRWIKPDATRQALNRPATICEYRKEFVYD